MGEYYLVARDLKTDEIFRIPIDRKWYMPNCDSERIYGNDIAAIDYITSKFNTKEEFIHDLHTKNYIDTEDVELYITHLHRYHQNQYVKQYDIIVNSNDRVLPLIELAKLRINGEKIEKDNKIVDNILNKFISKCFGTRPFYELMTSPFSKMDKYVVDKIMEYRKKPKIDWSLKHRLGDKKTSYLVIRNIISMWNLYDELYPTVKDLGINEQSRQIVYNYGDMLNVKRISKPEKSKLKVKLDKNYIEGQISLDQYLEYKTKQEEQKEIERKEEIDPLKEMYEKADKLKQEPFDSFELQELEKIYGRRGIINHLNFDLITSLSAKDRFILGFIDYVDYENITDEESRKNK